MTLPLCEHRGDELTRTAPGSGAVRTVFECFQMHNRGRDDVAYVSAAQCDECGYSNERFDAAIDSYQPATPASPNTDEFADRWGQCAACQFREANFCLRAPGSCSLTQKLSKADFGCPMGKFFEITRGE